MRILFVGDVVGRGGRKIVRERLHEVQEEYSVDFTIANVENCAGGFGITPSLADKMLRVGLDVMTSGNHIWDRPEVYDYFAREPRLLRPGNYPPTLPGNYCFIGTAPAGISVAVVNLQGRVFMPLTDCPFRFIEERLKSIQQKSAVIVVDFHAEATSEKMAFGWFLDGKVTAVLGTHTHVPTADARILPGGSAYITDVGMTGSYESVIGMEVEGALSRLLTGVSRRLQPVIRSPQFCSVILEVDDHTGQAVSIQRCDLKSD
jgi:metallophosphoesterase (TIGR00282 family)